MAENVNNEQEKQAVTNTGTNRVPFSVVEAYKTIRTNLSFLQTSSKSKTVTFTSPEAGDGKSTTSVNVAIAFAQLGEKTLLIDADLRKSSVHKKLKLEKAPGLSNVLAGMSTLEETVKHTSASLDVLTAGQIPPNPSELLSSNAFKELIAKAEQEYDHIIIDTPPVNIVSDALIVGAATNGIVLIVKEGFSTTDAVAHAISAAKFAEIEILGVVMNNVNAAGKNYGIGKYKKYGYKYKNRYGYGYGYGYSYGNNYNLKNKKSKKKAEKNNK